jgi:predicted deacylase
MVGKSKIDCFSVRIVILCNYSKIVDRLNQLDLPLNLIGTVHDYPIYQLNLESSTNPSKSILITGGVHGDEPAGVEAALQFLERDNGTLLQRFSFIVIPCINPFGYVHETRENRDGVDINRSFETEEVSEVAIVKRNFR